MFNAKRNGNIIKYIWPRSSRRAASNTWNISSLSQFKYHQLFSHIFTGFSPQVQAEKEWHGLLPQRSQGICLKSWRSYWVAKVGLEKIQSRFGTLMMFGSTVMMLMPGSMDIMLVMMFMQMTLLRMMLLLMIMMRRPTSLHNRWSQADTVILYISVYIYILWSWFMDVPTVDIPKTYSHFFGNCRHTNMSHSSIWCRHRVMRNNTALEIIPDWHQLTAKMTW